MSDLYLPELQAGNETSEVETLWNGLCAAIILQAIEDWRQLDHGKEVRLRLDCNVVYSLEVEAFFLSRWFEVLLGGILPELDPETVRERFSLTEGEINARQASRTKEEAKIEARYLKGYPNFRRKGIRYGGEEPESEESTGKRKRRKRKTAHHSGNEGSGSSCLETSRKTP